MSRNGKILNPNTQTDIRNRTSDWIGITKTGNSVKPTQPSKTSTRAVETQSCSTNQDIKRKEKAYPKIIRLSMSTDKHSFWWRTTPPELSGPRSSLFCFRGLAILRSAGQKHPHPKDLPKRGSNQAHDAGALGRIYKQRIPCQGFSWSAKRRGGVALPYDLDLWAWPQLRATMD